MRILTLLFALSFSFFAKAQDDYFLKIQAFQDHLNEEYRDSEKSPLDKDDFTNFKELPFFPINETFRVVARFTRTPDEKTFEMPTTTERKPVYVKYGVASFVLDGKSYQLNIYQNKNLVKKEAYKDFLFLPFTDLTNGVESYGGGRYIDLKIPDTDSIIIDFNKAYNPYCAYSQRFSCPLVPSENSLNTMILAGVRIEDDWNVMKLEDLGFSIRFPNEPSYLEKKIDGKLKRQLKQFRYLGDFVMDSNFLFQVEVISYLESTCPQSSPNDYNDCFKAILAEKLKLTGGALMYLQKISMQGHDAYDFELLAQGKAFTKFRVVLVENRAYIASVATMYQAMNNESMDKFFDSFRMLK